MARIRSIKPDFFTSEDIGYLTVKSRLLYVALWLHADREGRMQFKPTSLAAQCMPFDMESFSDCMAELSKNRHIRLYIVNGKKYIDIPTFLIHQKPHSTEKKSTIPALESEINSDLTEINGFLNVNPRQERERERERERELERGREKEKEKPYSQVSQSDSDSVIPNQGEVDFLAKTAGFDLTGFFAFYDKSGWRISGEPIRNWKALARSWSERQKSFAVGGGDLPVGRDDDDHDTSWAENLGT